MPLYLCFFFSPDKHTLQCLKAVCTTVICNTSGCLLQFFYFLYYWIHGYCVTGLQKQASDEYQGVHDFSLQGNTMLKCCTPLSSFQREITKQIWDFSCLHCHFKDCSMGIQYGCSSFISDINPHGIKVLQREMLSDLEHVPWIVSSIV